MTAPFVHLHLHTEYSIVDGTVRIPALIDRCVEEDMPAVALTDHGNLFGLVKFYRRALAAGVKPIIGVDLKLRDDEPRPGLGADKLGESAPDWDEDQFRVPPIFE